MATYYKYQNPSEIGAAPTLDWGTVANNINETLQKQEEQRFLNREQDKKLTNEILTKVNEVSMTSDPKANAILTRGTYNTKEGIFQNFNDLKNGKISRSDFNITQQNTKSSIAELAKFSTEYQGRYAKFQKDLSEGKVTEFSKAAQEYMGSFQNMKDKDLIYNRKDGFMYITSLDPETREPVDGPLGALNISSLNTEKIYNDPKINLPEKLASYTDKIQPFIKIIREGKIESKEGIQMYPEFNNFMTNLVEAIAPDDFSKADLLTQLGIYDVDVKSKSTDKTLGSKIAGDGSISPDITPEMTEKLKTSLARFIVANEGYKETGTEVFAPQAPRGGGDGKPPKYGEPKSSPVKKLTRNGKLDGVAMGVSGVVMDIGKGIQERIDAVSYDKGEIVMKITKISGTETDEITTGDSGRDGTVKVGEGKKDVKTDVYYKYGSKNAPSMENYITSVPYPGKNRNFANLAEAQAYLIDQYNLQKNKGGGGSKDKKTKGKTGKTIVVPE